MAVIEGLNGAGVSLSANAGASEATKNAGHILVLVALVLQVLVILVFACLSTSFHQRCIKAQVPMQTKAVKSTLITLYMSMILIFVRCVYRLVENATGTTSVDIDDIEALDDLSPILRYEVYFYIFEASLMFVNSVLWNIRHPGPCLPHDHHIYLAQDGTEAKGETSAIDRRSFLWNMVNTLFCGLIFRDKKATTHLESHELIDQRQTNEHSKTISV